MRVDLILQHTMSAHSTPEYACRLCGCAANSEHTTAIQRHKTALANHPEVTSYTDLTEMATRQRVSDVFAELGISPHGDVDDIHVCGGCGEAFPYINI